MMQTLMDMDDGGRRADVIALEQRTDSPVNRLAELGSQSFIEPLPRHAAERHCPEDKREERSIIGSVKWKTETNVPDVGGLGWRTKTGHLLKNQSYYIQKPKVNLWDVPTHAGINTWKEWHGPKMRTDAEMMERLDHYDEEEDHWKAKKTFVNTTRVETLDRFYNRKVNRSMHETSSSWAPHHRAKREVHSSYETFDSCMGEKPEKELKKVYTEKVLQRDREAIRGIAKRIQNEETWKQVFKQMEQERRQDIRADLQMRQAQTDRLMQMSGQPLLQDPHHPPLPNNCSIRSEELSQPRLAKLPKDVTKLTDFRGLIHADQEHALEQLFPGNGHELSVEFRASATRSIEPGWPPPPAAATPRAVTKTSREFQMKKGMTITKGSIPVTSQRLEKVATRVNEDLLAETSKAQFLPTVAPPPPSQRRTLMHEDFSPYTTLRDQGRVTGNFSRLEQSIHPTSPSNKSMDGLPPPTRSMVYPVLVGGVSSPNSPASQVKTPSMRKIASAPAFQTMSLTQMSQASGISSCKSRSKKEVGRVCDELDRFEAEAASVPRISNFFGTPRRCKMGSSCSQPIPTIDADR